MGPEVGGRHGSVSGMADRSDPGSDRRQPPAKGTPEYDWLYGSGAGAPGGQGDPDATEVLPTSGQRPEATRRLPTMQPPGSPRQPNQTAYQAPPPLPPSRQQPAAEPPPPHQPPPPAPPTGGGPRRRPRARGVWRAVKVLLLLWLVFLVAVPIYAWTRIAKVDASPDGERPAEQPGTTYLIVGSDSREGLSAEQEDELSTGDAGGQRTDTIMLLHTGSGPNLLMSIPRDSLVPIPGHDTGKINAAYAYGGAKLLVQTIEQNTGIRIDDYVEVGFTGVVSMVDAVGGVRICPKENMDDPLAGLKIEKGCQEADGKTALAYSRSRHVSNLGDIARAEHQREVVGAVGKKALSPWTFVLPWRYLRLNLAAADSFRIGEGTGPIAVGKFGWAMTHVGGDGGLTCGVPISDLAVHWDAERSQRMFAAIADDDTESIGKELCTPSGLPE